MGRLFETGEYGKTHVQSHLSRCGLCNKLTLLSSYFTTLFLHSFKLPWFPIKRVRILDECPECGFRGVATARKYSKERKHNLAEMMDGFSTHPDDPGHCAQALHTLMVYNEEAWFKDIRKSYGLRFENNPQIQHIIAQGLCRFGEYDLAIEHCRKAINLGSGEKTEQLMQFCLSALVMQKHALSLEKWVVEEESSIKAFLPIITIVSTVLICLIWLGASSLQNHRAWLVNGSTQSYSFQIDDETYALGPGERRSIKLKLGSHLIEYPKGIYKEFDYSISLFKQILGRNLLVINPDAMALLSTADPENEKALRYSHSLQVHVLPGVSQPLFGFDKKETLEDEKKRLTLHRPETHLGMVEFMESLHLDDAKKAYARRALTMNPATPEAGQLLPIALADTDPVEARRFLSRGLERVPTLMPWHLYYQHMMADSADEHDLVAEYRERFKEHPNEPENAYLLGRIIESRPVAQKFLEQSEKENGMHGGGYSEIADNLMIDGDFKNALAYSNKAVIQDPNNRSFLTQHEQILLALRRYDDLIAYARRLEAIKSEMNYAQKIVLYLTCAGLHPEAEKEAIRLSEAGKELLSILHAKRFYAVGNMNDYLDCLEEANDPHAKVESLIYHHRIADAAVELETMTPYRYWENMVLYCAAIQENLPEVARQQLDLLTAGNKTGPHSAVAALCTTEEAPDLESVRKLDIPANEKTLLAVVLGLRFPEHRTAYFELAAQYNFNREYPYLLIQKWIRPTLKSAAGAKSENL